MSVFEVFYVSVMVLLGCYGLHRYWLVWGGGRGRVAACGEIAPTDCEFEELPSVLIQLPVYNEPEIFDRLVASAADLDWPLDRLEIQVLDDSDDGSEERVHRVVEDQRARGVSIRHLHRWDRTGFKAGALQAGLDQTSADFVAIFDADFSIPKDFLRRAMPPFSNPELAMVQGRWDFSNADESWLTRTQMVLLDGHFHVEHRARAAAGRFFNFNGTAGVWRVDAIRDAGGWQARTVTEDLELSLRAWLRGWKFCYLDDLQVPSELPDNMAAYKIQQNRWVSGSLHTAVEFLGPILRSRLPLTEKLDLFFLLTGNITYVLLLLLVVAVPQAVLLRFSVERSWLWADLPFFVFATLSVFVFYTRARRPSRSMWRHLFVQVPTVMALGLGLTLHNSRAAIRGIFRRVKVFERTPKGRHPRSTGRWTWVIWCEAALAIYVLASLALSVSGGSVASVPFLGLFAVGFLTVFLGSVLPASRVRRLPDPPLRK